MVDSWTWLRVKGDRIFEMYKSGIVINGGLRYNKGRTAAIGTREPPPAEKDDE